MDAFAPVAPKLALAVSGGPDSMALAYCAKRWGQRELVALIVEHGLRPESPAEAVQVRDNLRKLGIEAEILPWSHGEIHGRVHEKAREARYSLLADACRRHGAGDLLIAHHADDQAETVLMRLAKGTGIDGLAGILPQNTRDGIRLLRPFLKATKDRLIETCNVAAVPFVIDPSNAAEKYARGRLRKIMPMLASEGLTAGSLSLLAARAREAKEVLDLATADFLNAFAQAQPGGSVVIDRDALRRVPRAIALRALAAGLRYVHDGDYPPEYASLDALLAAISGGEAEHIRTLYGCMASVSEKKAVLLREPSAASGVLSLAPGTTVLWDNRWLVSAASDAPAATIRALGSPSHDALDALAPGLRHAVPQGRVRASLPALWEGGVLRAVPSLEGKAPYGMAYRKQTFP
ncbi:MAG: tRNA lysidine(34) synthetase TilS [Alphaproteobacteria bacterium]|nr:tRNA lysidine(34) synthetase TilS [Alphaproteobacteria bacterium]